MFRLTDKVVFLTGCGSVGNSSSHRGSIRSMASRTSCSVISGAMPRAARQVPTSISGLRSSARIWPVRKNQGSGELVIDPQSCRNRHLLCLVIPMECFNRFSVLSEVFGFDSSKGLVA